MTTRKIPRAVPIVVTLLALLGMVLAITWPRHDPGTCDKADDYLAAARAADRAGDARLADDLTDLFVKYETQCNTTRKVHQ